MKWRKTQASGAVACFSLCHSPSTRRPNTHTRESGEEKLIQFTFHFKFINHVHTKFSPMSMKGRAREFFFAVQKYFVLCCKTSCVAHIFVQYGWWDMSTLVLEAQQSLGELRGFQICTEKGKHDDGSSIVCRESRILFFKFFKNVRESILSWF